MSYVECENLSTFVPFNIFKTSIPYSIQSLDLNRIRIWFSKSLTQKEYDLIEEYLNSLIRENYISHFKLNF